MKGEVSLSISQSTLERELKLVSVWIKLSQRTLLKHVFSYCNNSLDVRERSSMTFLGCDNFHYFEGVASTVTRVFINATLVGVFLFTTLGAQLIDVRLSNFTELIGHRRA